MTRAQDINGQELEFLKYLAKNIDIKRLERLEMGRTNWNTILDIGTLLLEINSCIVGNVQDRREPK